jgi:hypothetical protein
MGCSMFGRQVQNIIGTNVFLVSFLSSFTSAVILVLSRLQRMSVLNEIFRVCKLNSLRLIDFVL